MMDHKQLRLLIKLMVDNGLTEVDLQDAQGERVKLKRGNSDQPTVQYLAAPPAAAPVAAQGPAPAAPVAPGGDKEDGLLTIASPMVGTFYSSPSPDAPPFASVGDRISSETVVCLVEAMKVFNEIKAEVNGTIAAVMVSSGQAVEFGQPMFKVKPG
ncbi:MAG: acetyl-CoA carboxylase biotin carboxyl carrier protein [Phycisphaeraceae bacterium]